MLKPLSRLPYLAAGSGLFALKFLLDALLARLYHQPYSPLIYVSPADSPLVHPPEEPGYWLAMWALALPFIAAGLILTLRRLRDARVPQGLVFLFFVPFLNLLFFLVCALLPSRGSPEAPTSRSASRAPRTSFKAAIWIAASIGAIVGLIGAALSIGALELYGSGLLLGTPVISGFVTATATCYLHAPSRKGVALATLLSLGLCAFVAIAFAMEGFICILMAAPLVIVGSLLGSFLGFRCFAARTGTPQASTGTALALLPLMMIVESVTPLPALPSRPVESRVIVAAPAEIVWRNVIRFPAIPPSDDWIFRMGVAEPIGAEISGEGPGALRRCRFTTGEFLEPIEIWSPAHDLTFSVIASPDPMRELTLWKGIRPPHLNGYLESTRGQFLMRPLPGDRTLLIGRTWYRTNMAPEIYWRLWSDWIIHSIHLRVLAHVARLAEIEFGSHRVDLIPPPNDLMGSSDDPPRSRPEVAPTGNAGSDPSRSGP
ncbi:MAG TPA: hypothetical protein VGR38_04955 [Candidatus Polarisedimenticolia bacterium]|nr:hypothetical protein [Candidatus Polarisedimenticolia bacterium]